MQRSVVFFFSLKRQPTDATKEKFVACKKLTIEGKVALAAGVTFVGDVKVVNTADECKTLAKGTYSDQTIEL